MPYNMPIVNPMSSPAYLLAELPPMMLVIGSRDILLGDNLAFAQAAQAAGAAVQVEVFEGMCESSVFSDRLRVMSTQDAPALDGVSLTDCGVIAGHDFQEESVGCGAHGHLEEGLTAVKRVGEFFASGGNGCKVVCAKGERCSGTAPVNWHYHVNRLPMATEHDCGY